MIWKKKSVIYLIDEDRHQSLSLICCCCFFSHHHHRHAFAEWSFVVAVLFNNQKTSGMCKFGGNCHKQFGTNYLYVQSGFIVYYLCVCVRSSLLYMSACHSLSDVRLKCLKVNFKKQGKRTTVMLKKVIASCRCHRSPLEWTCALIVVLKHTHSLSLCRCRKHRQRLGKTNPLFLSLAQFLNWT